MTTTPVRQELGADDPRTLGGFRLLYRTEEAVSRSRPASPDVAAPGRPSPAVPDGVHTYLARSTHDARTVVLTAARPDRADDPGLRAWLRQAAAAAAAAACRWTVPLVAADPEAALPWVAHAYCPALPLVRCVEEWGPWDEAAVRVLGAALAEALQRVHQAGLTHPRFSPETVVLAVDGPRLVGLGHTVPGGDPAADVRSWGEVLLYAATGERHRDAVARLAPGLAATLLPALGEAPQGRPTPARLRAALGGPQLTAELTTFPLSGPAVARLTAQAAEALAAEASEEAAAGEDGADRPTRRLRPRDDGAAAGEDGTDQPTRRLRPRDTPTTRLRAVSAQAAPEHRGGSEAVSAGHGPSRGAPSGDAAGSPTPPSPASGPPPAEDAQVGGADAVSPAPSAAPAGWAPAGPSRRRLLGYVGAGAVGVLAGGGAVAGWVTGRGGLQALSAPSARGPSRPAATHSAPPGTPPTALWRYDVPVKSGDNVPLAWADRLAVVFGQYGAVALDLRTGREVWHRNDITSRGPGLLIGRGLAVVASEGRFVAFTIRTGRRRWADENFFQAGRGRSDLGFEEDSGLLSVTPDGRTLFFVGRSLASPTPDGEAEYHLVAYDTRAREERWRAPLPREYSYRVRAEPRGDSVVLLGSRDDALEVTAYRLTDGRKLWQHAHEDLGSLERVSPAVAGGLLFATHEGELRAVELRSGRQRWRRKLAGYRGTRLGPGVLRAAPAGSAAGRGGQVYYCADSERNVYAVNARTGEELWRTPVNNDSRWGDATALHTSRSGNTLLASSSSGVSALDARTGRQLWHFSDVPHEALEPYVIRPVGELALVIHTEVVFALPVD